MLNVIITIREVLTFWSGLPDFAAANDGVRDGAFLRYESAEAPPTRHTPAPTPTPIRYKRENLLLWTCLYAAPIPNKLLLPAERMPNMEQSLNETFWPSTQANPLLKGAAMLYSCTSRSLDAGRGPLCPIRCISLRMSYHQNTEDQLNITTTSGVHYIGLVACN